MEDTRVGHPPAKRQFGMHVSQSRCRHILVVSALTVIFGKLINSFCQFSRYLRPKADSSPGRYSCKILLYKERVMAALKRSTLSKPSTERIGWKVTCLPPNLT